MKKNDEKSKYSLLVKKLEKFGANTEKSLHGLEDVMNFLVENCVTHSELDEKFEKFGKQMRSDVADFKDAILHELVKIRENQEILGYQRTRTDDHEKRIERLEVHVGIVAS